LDLNTLCSSCFSEKGNRQNCPRCGYLEGTAPESLLHLPPGTIIHHKFLLGRVLGHGGFGITYLAWDLTLNFKLAIKEYLPQQLATRSAGQNTVTVYKSTLTEEFRYGLTKFIEEARTLARFNEHPNIVTVRDYFEANGTAYLVMNYYEGVTLQRYLASKGGKISVEQSLKIFMPVLDALKEVHAAGILHRDISPDNLLIDKSGRVILIDFGAARQAMGDKSKSLSVIMKAGYSPPEQYQSRGKQGPWTDIYAVAASFYRAITGIAPLEAIDRLVEDELIAPSQLGIAIEPKQEQILLKALAVQVKDRYQAVGEFQNELVTKRGKGQADEVYNGVRSKKPDGTIKAKIKTNEEDIHEIVQPVSRVKKAEGPKNRSKDFQQPVGRTPKYEPSYTVSKKVVKTAVALILCGLLIVIVTNIFSGDDVTTDPPDPFVKESKSDMIVSENEDLDPASGQDQDNPESTELPEPVDAELKVIDDGNYLIALVTKETTLKSSYAPTDLLRIPDYMNPARELWLREEAFGQLEKLWQAAADDGVTLTIISAYRSYDYQQTLFQNYANRYGEEETNRFSERAGQSEHQLGTTVDFGGSLVDLEAAYAITFEGLWLAAYAYKYGFVMSYPEGKEQITGYIFKPWHYRYIGIEAAAEWHESGLILKEFLQQKPQYFE
jgi:serine/threonine protein kinase